MSSPTRKILLEIYNNLFKHYGPQNWWPGETPFEVCVGAILTQNTAWANVEKAIRNLKNAGVLDFEKMLHLPESELADLIRPAGYFNIKTKRLKIFLKAVKQLPNSFDTLFTIPKDKLREVLLSITGIGPETADSMVLYAFSKSSFVIDSYTKRILMRHSLADAEADYYQLKELFENHLEENVELFNEYHALIVSTAKDFCRKSKPKCEECPLKHFNGGPVL